MDFDLVPNDEEIKAIQTIATHAAKSKFFDKLGGQEGCMCIALMARELGVPIMQALSGGIRYILGNVEISPRLMNSMIRQRGHRIEIIESSNTKCTIKGTRKDTGETYTCSYTIEDGRQAGLVKPNSGWEKFASDMLFARAISRLSRRLFPDIIGPAYVEGEIVHEEASKQEMEVSTADATIIEVEAEKHDSISIEEMYFMLLSQLDIKQEGYLLEYLHFAQEKLPKDKSLEETVNKWLDNPILFMDKYEKYCAKQMRMQEIPQEQP